MNWIDSHRHVDEGVTVWKCMMPVNRLLFADELVLHAWIFSTGSSSARIWSVFWCLRPSRNENRH